jgi:hypothetical protein
LQRYTVSGPRQPTRFGGPTLYRQPIFAASATVLHYLARLGLRDVASWSIASVGAVQRYV